MSVETPRTLRGWDGLSSILRSASIVALISSHFGGDAGVLEIRRTCAGTSALMRPTIQAVPEEACAGACSLAAAA